MLLRVGDQNYGGEHEPFASRILGDLQGHIDGVGDARGGKHPLCAVFAVMIILIGEAGDGIVDRIVFVKPAHDGFPFVERDAA
jgi:hypothetical protein